MAVKNNMLTYEELKEKFITDKKFSIKSVSIQNYISYYEYYLSLGIPSHDLLKDTSFTVGNFDEGVGWVSFRDSAIMQLNAVEYAKKLTTDNMREIGRQTIERKIVKAHLFLVSMLTLKEVYKRITTITSYYIKHSRTEIEAVTNNYALLSMYPDPFYGPCTPGAMAYVSIGVYRKIPEYKRMRVTDERIVCNFAPLANLLYYFYHPLDLTMRETGRDVFINNKKAGEKVVLREYLKAIPEISEETIEKFPAESEGILITDDYIVNGSVILHKGEVFDAPITIMLVKWVKKKRLLKIIGNLINQNRDRISIADEYESQLNLANQRYFEARRALEELEKKNRVIEKVSEALKEERDNLDQRVKEKTADLEAANEELKAVYDNQTRFFINLTHELKTPLSIILSHTDAVLNRYYGRKVDYDADIFQVNKKQLLQMKEIVNSLMVYARIQMDNMKLNPEVCDLGEVMDLLFSDFHSQAEIRRIRFQINHSEFKDCLVEVDKNLIMMVMRNLVSNALKFNVDGGSIRIEYEASEDGHIIRIADSGIGIKAVHLPLIFDRFYQIENRDDRNYEGSGIGLSLAKEIVELHGGRIEVESDGESGSVFSLYLKQAEVPTFTGKSESLDGVIPGIEAVSGSEDCLPDGYSILIVEDNADLSDTLLKYLSPFFSIRTAGNGAKALGVLEEYRPDIIVTDIMMPVMDGFTLIRKIRENPELSRIPILVLSARDDEEGILSAYDYGIIDYISKPFSIDLLKRKLINILSWIAPDKEPGRKVDRKKLAALLKKRYGISKREFEVMEHLQSGETKKDISQLLDLSPNTVKRHIENIYGKLEIHDRYQLFNLMGALAASSDPARE